MLALVGFLMAQTPSRVANMILELEEGDILDIVTNTGNTHSDQYTMRVLHEESGQMIGTDLGTAPNFCRIAKVGSSSAGYTARAIINQSIFDAVWPIGSHLKYMIWYNTPMDPASGIEPYPNLQYVEVTKEVPTGGGVMNFTDILTVPPFAPEAPEEYEISGFFISENWDFEGIELTVEPAVDEDAIMIDPETGYYFVFVPDGWSGSITPYKENYIFDPEYREYQDVTGDYENENYNITKFVDPEIPVITYPEAGAVFTWEEAAPITFTWLAPEAGFAPEYYEVKLNDGEWLDVEDALEWTSDLLGAGEYTFFLRGVINTALGKVKTPLRATLSSAFGNVANKGAGPVASVEFEVIIEDTPDIPADIPTYIAPGVEIESDIDLNYTPTPTPEQEDQIIAVLPNFNNLNETVVVVLSGQGTTNLSFTIDQPGSWYAVLIVGGNVVLPDDPNHYPVEVPPTTTITFTGVNFGAKGDVMVVMGTGTDPTLPVELSSFNAVLTAQNFVKLSWTSESETNMLGYRVYRSETDNQAEAQLITPIMIEATNTSTTQHYGIEDKEVSVGNTYYYWLEAVDYSHSSFYGYRSVEVVGEIVPELPVSSIMGNAYPNPFKATTNTKIDVRVKAGENANVTIYNVLGQVVKSYKVPEGAHTINWDGRDNRGKLCGSGIYFYKMSTPSTNQTKKMVIVK